MKTMQIYTIAAPADRESAKMIEQTLSDKFPELKFIPMCTDEPLSKTWSLRVADRIRQADVVICLVGEYSYLQSSTNWEITYSLSLNKPLHAMSLSKHDNSFVPPFVLIDKGIKTRGFDLRELCKSVFTKMPAELQKKLAA